MEKWADYLISEVSYTSDHLISIAIRHKDTDQGITKGKPIDRLTIVSDIQNGLFYITIYNQKNSWKKGHRIQAFSIGSIPYLRIDQNKVQLDFLGDLPEPVESEEKATHEQILRLEQLEKQIQELEEVNTKHKIIQTLHQQNKKLDDIERKLHDLETTNIQPNSLDP